MRRSTPSPAGEDHNSSTPASSRPADAHESVRGSRPRMLRVASTTDARHYLNELACPALCYGPRVRNIHGSDEAVELASIVAGARTLTRFIPAFMTS